MLKIKILQTHHSYNFCLFLLYSKFIYKKSPILLKIRPISLSDAKSAGWCNFSKPPNLRVHHKQPQIFLFF